MAACSEQELEEKSADEGLSHSACLDNAMFYNVDADHYFEGSSANRPKIEKFSQIEDQSKTGDLKKLSDDEFLNLLEEASTFNKPNNEESVLLKQLRKEVAETDPCENVSRSESSCAAEVSGHSRRSKNTCYSKSRGNHGLDGTDAAAASTCLTQKTFEITGRKKSGNVVKCREDSNVKNASLVNTVGLGKTGLQSQSLQDLASTESIKNAGRNVRKLQKVHRASSFSSAAAEDADNGSELESFRTSLKCGKKLSKQQAYSIATVSTMTSVSAVSDKSANLRLTPNVEQLETSNIDKHKSGKLCSSKANSNGIVLSPSLLIDECNNHMRDTTKSEKNCSFQSVQCLTNNVEEIEMKEIKKPKNYDTIGDEQDDISNGTCYKIKSDGQQSASKFYVDCTDVDSTVTFPLKLVSSNGERNESRMTNNEAMNDNLKCRQITFPCTQWTRPLQVHSFIGSLPMDQDSFSTRGSDYSDRGDDKGNRRKKGLRHEFADDKPTLNTDVNGNPFTRTGRSSGLTSFVSAALLDYAGNNSMVSESQSSKLDWPHRKNKRTRNNIENRNFILAENIAGHRGKEDIDTLLKYINSSDKKNKTVIKGSNSNNQNQMPISKNSLSHESEKKKNLGRDIRNCHSKNIINTAKKKSSQSNSEDDSIVLNDQLLPKSDILNIGCKVIPLENNVTDEITSDIKSCRNTLPECTDADVKCFEWNCISVAPLNSTEGKSEPIYLSSEIECNASSSSINSTPPSNLTVSNGISSFAADFYSVTETVSQTFEESGFRVVKKKQRKRYQGKRSESYRWHSAVVRAGGNSSAEHECYVRDKSSHNSGIILLSNLPLSQRNQCGKQDSRRKSTSSVPHSEHSSADNSDLDSVHSLPVRGSAPHPTQPHPHTTPSSSSSTPQASYADIARMPVSSMSKITSPTLCGSSACANSVLLGKSLNNETGLNSCDFVPETALSSEVTSPPSALKTEEDVLIVSTIPVANRTVTSSVIMSENNSDLPPSSADKSVFSCTKSTREINTQTEPLNLSMSKDSETFEGGDNANVGTINQKTSNEYSVIENSVLISNSEVICNSSLCTYKNENNCSCSRNEKYVPVGQKFNRGNKRPAVVIMDNCLPSKDACDVSFGIDLDELLQMSSNDKISCHASTVTDETSHCASVPFSNMLIEQLCGNGGPAEESSVGVESENANIGSFDSDNEQPNKFITPEKSVQNRILHNKISSPSEKLFLSSGQPVHFLESEVDTQTFNYNQIVSFFGCAWDNVLKDYYNDSCKVEGREMKIKYYSDCC